MNQKTQQLLTYLVNSYPKHSVTSLMKLSYLADLINSKENGEQISNFKYRRYTFGPFDEKIYSYMELLTKEGVVTSNLSYTSTGDEYITYSLSEGSKNTTFDKLKTDEKEILDGLIEQVKGYGAKTLTEIAYKTKPMKVLKATRGGKESFNRELNLSL